MQPHLIGASLSLKGQEHNTDPDVMLVDEVAAFLRPEKLRWSAWSGEIPSPRLPKLDRQCPLLSGRSSAGRLQEPFR